MLFPDSFGQFHVSICASGPLSEERASGPLCVCSRFHFVFLQLKRNAFDVSAVKMASSKEESIIIASLCRLPCLGSTPNYFCDDTLIGIKIFSVGFLLLFSTGKRKRKKKRKKCSFQKSTFIVD